MSKVFTSLGADIVFVLDTSPSMAAKDVDNNTRINAAKESIKAIAGENKGFRYGIVVFGSEASVLIPPTNDEVIFSQRLNDCQIGLLGDGSAIGDGLSTAVCHLLSSSAPKKYIILLTDGENNAGTILQSREVCGRYPFRSSSGNDRRKVRCNARCNKRRENTEGTNLRLPSSSE